MAFRPLGDWETSVLSLISQIPLAAAHARIEGGIRANERREWLCTIKPGCACTLVSNHIEQLGVQTNAPPAHGLACALLQDQTLAANVRRRGNTRPVEKCLSIFTYLPH